MFLPEFSQRLVHDGCGSFGSAQHKGNQCNTHYKLLVLWVDHQFLIIFWLFFVFVFLISIFNHYVKQVLHIIIQKAYTIVI